MLEDKQNIKVLICFAEGLNTNGKRFLKEFEKFEERSIISGGLAGDNWQF